MTFKYSVRPHFAIPKRMKKNPSLTIRQMSERVPKATRLKSRKVGISKCWEGNTPRFLEGYTTYRAETQNTENGHRYKIVVFSPTPKVTLDTKVIIDSPVAVFTFRYEYALAKRGNAFIYRSNGDPPIKTNPGLVPGFDHHVYRVLQYLFKNTTARGLRAGSSKK